MKPQKITILLFATFVSVVCYGQLFVPVVLRQMKRAYLQNINVNSEKEVGGGIVMTGKSVTNKISKGEVAVREGGSLRLNYTEKAILDKGFKVKLGGKLTISKREWI